MEWLSDFDIPTLLGYLSNPVVLIVSGVLFIVFLKLKRRNLAAIILGLEGYYHVFQALPTRTESSVSDLKSFLSLMGSQEFLTFIGGIVATTFGIVFIVFMKK